MKYFFYAVLGIHCLAEAIVAVLMWVNPEVFFPGLTEPIRQLARSFGIGAGAVTLLGIFMLFKPSEGLIKYGALTLMAYHIGILSTQVINLWPVFPWAAVVFHGFLVIGFGLLAKEGVLRKQK